MSWTPSRRPFPNCLVALQHIFAPIFAPDQSAAARFGLVILNLEGAPRAGSWTTMGKDCDSRGPAVCSVCHVRRRSDWDGLDDAAHDLLARGLSRREYGSGEVIFAQGDANTGVYCVSSGAVAIRRLDAHGNSVLLGLAIRAIPSAIVHFWQAARIGPAPRHLVRATSATSPATPLRPCSRPRRPLVCTFSSAPSAN